MTQILNETGEFEEWGGVGDAGKVHIANGLISHHWAGTGTTNAPDATAMDDYTVGVNQSGIATADVYHVIDGVWVDTGAAVSNLYGA